MKILFQAIIYEKLFIGMKYWILVDTLLYFNKIILAIKSVSVRRLK